MELRGHVGGPRRAGDAPGPLDVSLPLPGLYNVYNAVAAAALALELGASLEQVGPALEGFGGSFGRVETIPVDGRPVSILLVKNPAGANEVLRTLTLEEGQVDLWLALNDGIADGRDVSWIWDADFELLAGRVRRATCSGTRAEEMALRLKYAGHRRRAARGPRPGALARRRGGAGEDGRPLYALPTYTALLELRDLLADRGLAGRWADERSEHVFGYASLVADAAAAAGRGRAAGYRRRVGRGHDNRRSSPATRCTCAATTARGPPCTWRSWTCERRRHDRGRPGAARSTRSGSRSWTRVSATTIGWT